RACASPRAADPELPDQGAAHGDRAAGEGVHRFDGPHSAQPHARKPAVGGARLHLSVPRPAGGGARRTAHLWVRRRRHMSFVAPDASIACSPEVIAMLERQAHAWTIGDFSEAAGDWHPHGVLTAPGNRVPFEALARTIAAFHRDYGDLVVTITNVLASADGRQ